MIGREVLAALLAGVAAASLAGLILPPTRRLAPRLRPYVVGAMRWRSRVDRAIDRRREQMRIELYTVNQLMAMQLRAGGGVMQAIRQLVRRGRAIVIEELGEALRGVESGATPGEALEREAELTAEPSAARTYRVLASGVEHGADLASALLELSEDIRDDRR